MGDVKPSSELPRDSIGSLDDDRVKHLSPSRNGGVRVCDEWPLKTLVEDLAVHERILDSTRGRPSRKALSHGSRLGPSPVWPLAAGLAGIGSAVACVTMPGHSIASPKSSDDAVNVGCVGWIAAALVSHERFVRERAWLRRLAPWLTCCCSVYGCTRSAPLALYRSIG